MNKKFIIPAIVIAVLSIVFFSIPNSLELFSFSGIKLLKGEIWRLLTFQFTHTNTSHLLENLLALGVTALLAKEINFPSKYFTILFLVTGMIIALLESIIFPLLILAGASLGIYGVLGGISARGTQLVPQKVLILLLGLSVFAKYFINMFFCPTCITSKLFIQTICHISGVIAGILIFYPITNKKTKILTGNKDEKN